MPIIIASILIVCWMYFSDKMNGKLRNSIVILVDLAASITFCMVQSSAANRIILVIVLFLQVCFGLQSIIGEKVFICQST